MGKLINKEELNNLLKESSMMRWAERELELAGYTDKGPDNPDTWMRKQVMETLAVFVSHENSGFSANVEMSIVKKLMAWKPLCPLKLDDSEWEKIGENTYQNKRCSAVFKEFGKIIYNGAMSKMETGQIRYGSDKVVPNEKPTYWTGSIMVEYDRLNFLTGKVYHGHSVKEKDIKDGYTPRETIYIPTIGVEVMRDSWLFIVSKDEPKLKEYKNAYDVGYITINDIKGISIFDITSKVEDDIMSALKSDHVA